MIYIKKIIDLKPCLQLFLGAIDGKHVAFRPPSSQGSLYFNYKGYNSVVMMAVVDANYRFLYVDAGANGRISDGGVFRHSSLFEALQKHSLHLPPAKKLLSNAPAIPYHFVGDDAFPLMTNLMKPFSNRGLDDEKSHFNYRLSRARRVVENAFGILSNRFQVFQKPINLSAEKVQIIILACSALHNFLLQENRTMYIDSG